MRELPQKPPLTLPKSQDEWQPRRQEFHNFNQAELRLLRWAGYPFINNDFRPTFAFLIGQDELDCLAAIFFEA